MAPASTAREGSSPIRFREVERSAVSHSPTSAVTVATSIIPTANGSGVAMFDYDGDGRLDLYFATTRNFTAGCSDNLRGNRLYRDQGDGSFEDVTDRACVGFRGFCHGVAVGDVDNNGYPDLYLTNYGPNVLVPQQWRRHVSDGRDFGQSVDPGRPRRHSSTLMATVGSTCTSRATATGPTTNRTRSVAIEAKSVRIYCSPTMVPPAPHFLFRNRGDGTFEDVTKRAGVLRRDGRYGGGGR